MTNIEQSREDSTTDSLDVPNEEGEEAGENDEHYEEDVQALNEFETLLESKSMGDISGTKTGLTFQVLYDLIEEITTDVIIETHKEAKLAAMAFTPPGVDIFGNNPQPASNTPVYECVNCHRPYPSARYAPHLEKCMGLAGRISSRVASRRIGADKSPASPSTPLTHSEDNANYSESDSSYVDKKRKRVNGRSRASSPARFGKTKQKKSNATDASSQSGLYGSVMKKLKLLSSKRASSASTSPAHSSAASSPPHGPSTLRYSISLPLESALEKTSLSYGGLDLDETLGNPITNENFDESIISSPATTTTQSSMADNEDIIDIDGDDDTQQASNRRYRYTNAMLNNSENHKH
ncbi:11363_t:CDS:10 [Paraglomus brasilianum]|uniref:SAGA-associated factor 11 n=1 Tax=Paraglomus brasilianum TaxID=144538 RepID=A0A9N9G095_9GLOM|nr:11363_t:CDS:10 [Paraglomus brasilianum]